MAVYMELDDKQKIIGFYLRDADGRISIDEDKHMELFDKQCEGFDVYYEDGEYSFVEKEPEPVVITPQTRIMTLKYKLMETDYQAIKFSEGELTEEEYAPIKQQRREWRAEINELEESISSNDNIQE